MTNAQGGDFQSIAYLFTDMRGFLMHVTKEKDEFHTITPPYNLSRIAVSGSMVPGWQSNADSDLYLNPDPSWTAIDPTSEKTKLLIFSNPVDPYSTEEGYSKDPRLIAKKAIEYCRSEGIADDVYIGPELEFHLFDSVRFGTTETQNFCFIGESDTWKTNASESYVGHSVGHATMHLAVPPIDRFSDIRDQIADNLKKVGIKPLHHTHESGPNQQEISIKHQDLLKSADQVQLYKYITKQTAKNNNLIASFMPYPIPYSQGNGMHVNLSLWKDGINRFYGGSANNLSDFARHFIAGILAHIRSLNSLTNPCTNSYKRLNRLYSLMSDVKYGYRNRSTVIRVPHFSSEDDCRIEIRFPDPSANPYLAFSALLLAGIDGIQNQTIAPEPVVINPKWYENPFNAGAMASNTIARDLIDALGALHADAMYLKKGQVFNDDVINSVIEDGSFFAHWNDTTPSPQEFQVHFST